ncbi:MAG: toll/interleukin-1 receptor domain-containing protein [Prosthecobacter sp.]
MTSPNPNPVSPLRVFVSYAHEDRLLKEAFDVNLKVLSKQGLVTTWTDTNLRGGDVWNDVIETELRSADLILFMVTNAFLASDFIRDNEVRISMELATAERAIIVPVILKPCGWREEKWAGRQPLPSLVKAVTDWEETEKGFDAVEKGLRDLIKWVQRKKGPCIGTDGPIVPPLHRKWWQTRAMLITVGVVVTTMVGWVSWNIGHNTVTPESIRLGQTPTTIPPPEISSSAAIDEWKLAEAQTRIFVTGLDGKSVDDHVVQAALQPTWSFIESGTNLRRTYSDGARFWLKFQSKRGDIAGPWTVTIYAKAVESPQRPTGFATMSAALPMLKTATPEGYTYTWSFLMNPFQGGVLREGVIAQEACGFLLGMGEHKRGFIPVGEHNIGLQIAGNDQSVLYRSSIKINVSQWTLPDRDSKLVVTDLSGVSIEDGHEIPAKRGDSEDPSGSTINPRSALTFGLKLQSKDEAIAGPHSIEYFFRATTLPTPPFGVFTISVASKLLLPNPTAEGYTAKISSPLTLPSGQLMEPNAEILLPKLRLTTDDGQGPLAEIPKGVHDIGIQITGRDGVVYRGVLKLRVE